MEPTTLGAPPTSASRRHTDNDGNESMVDDEVTPRARDSRRKGRNRGHLLDRDRTPTLLNPVFEENERETSVADHQRQLDSQLGVSWTHDEQLEQDETEDLEDEETTTRQDETEEDLNVPDYALRFTR